MKTLLELAERCEEATAPDRVLDAEIAVAIDFRADDSNPSSARALHRNYGGSNTFEDIAKHWPRLPAYTGSIDAARLLIDSDCWKVENHPVVGPHAVVGRQEGYGFTTALSLVAAALRARADA